MRLLGRDIILVTSVKRGNNVKNITKEQVIELQQRGMTQKQISDFLGCSINTVKRRLQQ